jgi:hypothetical protein
MQISRTVMDAGTGYRYSRAMFAPTARLLIAPRIERASASAGVDKLGDNNPDAPLRVDD